jgi:hypothetical protein
MIAEASRELPQGQPFGKALFKFGYGPGAQGIGTDFVDHRRILQVIGVSEVIASEPIAQPTLIGR